MAAGQYYIQEVNNKPTVFYDDGRGGGFKNVGATTSVNSRSYLNGTRVDPTSKTPLAVQPKNSNDATDPNFGNSDVSKEDVNEVVKLTLGWKEGRSVPDTQVLRYPLYQPAGADYDYVFFEFGEYAPPFLAGSQTATTPTSVKSSTISARYKQYQTDFVPINDDNYKRIILYMPQDISSTYAQNWQGKEISNIGKIAMSVANGNLSNISGYNLPDGIRNAFAAIFTNAINSVPGVGGNFTLNDVTGSTRGVVVNPNVEVLYDNPELREFSLKFKLTPYNEAEANVIRSICNTFKKTSLPGFGTLSTVKGTKNNEGLLGADANLTAGVGGGNYIRVPNLVRVSFMRGGSLHQYLPQYKVCAIKRVQVNYTPDGAYATYNNSSPVSTELTISFLETKLIFREEIDVNGVSL